MSPVLFLFGGCAPLQLILSPVHASCPMLQLGLRRLCSSRMSLGTKRLLHSAPSLARPTFQRFAPFPSASNNGSQCITSALPIPSRGSGVLLLGGLAGSLVYSASSPTAYAEEGREGEKAGTLCEVLTSLDQVTESQVREVINEMSDELLNVWRSQIQGLKETDGMDPHALASLDEKMSAMEALLEPFAQDGYAWLKTSGCGKLFVNYIVASKPMDDKEALATVAAQAGVCTSLLVELIEISKRLYNLGEDVHAEIKALQAATGKDK